MEDPIQELRDLAVSYHGEVGAIDMCEIADEIERAYMKLPLDADGVPIHVGDYVRLNPEGGIFTVRGVGVNSAGNPVMWGVRELNTQTTRHRIDGEVRHVQPDTVESLLEEALDDAAMLDRGVGYWPSAADITNIVNDYAERIRRVVD
ncbi:MAG: hypothetical protein IJ113_06480 [Eggerthellaceae bacterium]|nr:hypothetical protein [Eggerthellaceae bacterium]